MKTTDRSRLAAILAIPFIVGISASAVAAQLSNDEIRLLAALQKAYPATHFSSIAHTPIPGLYEVWMGANVAFVSDKNPRYMVFGHLFDVQDMTDLTAPKLAQAERMQLGSDVRDDAAPTLAIEQFPLADAIKTVHGTGGDASRRLVVFSDPACPYCKRLEPELEKLKDVTIYTFMLPFQGAALPTAIWCAADRQKAWRQTVQGGDRSLFAASSATACATPLERNLALAQRLKVQGTPTLLYANGHRTEGYADAGEIEARIKANPNPTAAKPAVAAHAPSQQETQP